MSKVFFSILSAVLLCACAPTRWLDIEVVVPADFTFPDTGKIAVLNASPLPSSMMSKSYMMSEMTPSEKFIYDTLITSNLFNGFFSVIGDSPSDDLRNADYFESRTSDTSRLLKPLPADSVIGFCRDNYVQYLITMEYYGFKGELTEDFTEWLGWESNLKVSYYTLWRIYKSSGEVINQAILTDTLYWFYNAESLFAIPEMTDAVREVFFLAGEKYGRHISPNWHQLSRSYYQIYTFGDDISLNKNRLIELLSDKKPGLSYKLCYNLAVVSESEDNLQDAVNWLEKSREIKDTEYAEYYLTTIKKRLEVREAIDTQAGFK